MSAAATFPGAEPALPRRSRKIWGFTLTEIMIVVAVIGLLAAIAIPNFIRVRKRAQATMTLEDCRIIESCKNQFAIENNKTSGFTPKVADIRPYLKVGSRLYKNVQLSNFRDLLGNSIVMGNVGTSPLIDDATRDYFADVVNDNYEFWGSYCR